MAALQKEGKTDSEEDFVFLRRFLPFVERDKLEISAIQS